MDNLVNRVQNDIRNNFITHILDETKTLKYFKDMYCKHAFDDQGTHWKQLYDSQAQYLKNQKQEYKERYGT